MDRFCHNDMSNAFKVISTNACGEINLGIIGLKTGRIKRNPKCTIPLLMVACEELKSIPGSAELMEIFNLSRCFI